MNLPLSSLLASLGVSAARDLGVAVASAEGSAAPPRAADRAGGSELRAGGIDAGILGLFDRRLEGNCPETCSPELCDCVGEFGYAEPCYQQLNSVCTATALSATGAPVEISDCVVQSYVSYYENVYCPFAACRVMGKSYQECQCESYVDFCAVYQNKEGYETDDKTLLYCSIASCCNANIDDDGRKICLEGSFQNELITITTTVAAVADEQRDEEDLDADLAAAAEDAAQGDGGDAYALESDVSESIDSTTGEETVDEEPGERDPAASQESSAVALGTAVSVASVGALAWFAM